jgi:glycerol-3-phosphate acyltransferase PlsX
VGNILLKFGESMTTVLSEMTQQEMDRQGLSADEQALVSNVLGEVSHHFDPESLGGAPLLGVNGNVLIGHGSSSPDVIEQMIHTAAALSATEVLPAIEAAFQSETA